MHVSRSSYRTFARHQTLLAEKLHRARRAMTNCARRQHAPCQTLVLVSSSLHPRGFSIPMVSLFSHRLSLVFLSLARLRALLSLTALSRKLGPGPCRNAEAVPSPKVKTLSFDDTDPQY
eukprot:1639723-Rhodomonas_salina.1